MKLPSLYTQTLSVAATVGAPLQPILLLVLRLWWGWSFFQTGRGKLLHLDRTAEFFSGLNIPLPKLNAIMAGATECGGGLLLMLGLCSRLISVPLAFTMLIAYATAEREALSAIVSDPDKFTGAAPFLFLLVALIVFAFGPGKFSIDALMARWARPGASTSAGATADATAPVTAR